MTVKVTHIKDSGTVVTTEFKNVWETQDNDDKFFVVKMNNHECELIEKTKIVDIRTEV